MDLRVENLSHFYHDLEVLRDIGGYAEAQVEGLANRGIVKLS